MLYEYKNTSHKKLTALLLGFLITLSIATTTYAIETTSIAKYNPELSKPIFSDKNIEQWSQKAILSVFNYNYQNYKRTFEHSSHYFTPEGWNKFMLALKNSNNLNAVINNKMTVSASSENNIKILKQGVTENKYSWNVEMPITVTYQGVNKKVKTPVLVNIVIVRTTETTDGIGISQYVTSSVK